MYRQGDLLIVPFGSIEGGAKRVANGVVQLGEATGHAHVLEDGEVYEHYSTTYLKSGGEARLVHDEHETITLPEGTYRVIRQREHAEDGSWTNVYD